MESGIHRPESAAGKTGKQYETTVPIPESLRDIGNTEIFSVVSKKNILYSGTQKIKNFSILRLRSLFIN